MHMRVNPGLATPSGVVDRVTGGSHHYAADRALADPILEAYPQVRETALDDLQFVGRAVVHLAQQGIDQFLILGYRLPSETEVHHVAQSVVPRARVVYVSSDSVVSLQASALVSASQRVAYIDSDPRNTDSILNDPATQSLIDFTRPVGVLFYGWLNYIADRDDPYGAAQNLLEEVPSGSYVAISHVTADGIDPGLFNKIESAYADVPNRFYFRDHSQVTRFFADWDIQEPGVVRCGDWSVQGQDPAPDRVMYAWCGLARKP
ncbi:SAM-dependent methyltransferase [Streptosporangium canum]|uniref:SAM-dependent methyltransferase n=1 Tax=Streptosporangium canum TaxID=324952 RepID=UPI0036B87559